MRRIPTVSKTGVGTRALACLGALMGAMLALMFWMPAHWLTDAVSGASQGRLVLDDARGTVWSGSARLVLTGGEGSRDSAALPGRVDWRLRPSLSGANMAINAPCCSETPVQVRASPGWDGGSLVVGPVRMRWPAALLAGLGTPWNTVQLQGFMTLSTPGLELVWQQGRLAVTGQARVEATDLASRLSTLKPLGSYRVDLTAANAEPSFKLETLSGSLMLSGQGQWTGGRLRFAGEATAVEGREAALSNLLNIIGRRDGSRSTITVG